MNYTEMVERIRVRTDFSTREIRLILDAQQAVIKEALYQQRSVRFKGLFEITPAERTINVPDGVVTKRRVIQRIMLKIRPLSTFRQEMNSWKNTP